MTEPSTTRQPLPAFDFSAPLVVGGLATGLMVIGAFGPWVKGPFGSTVSGTDGSNDGWLVVGAAVLAALVFYAHGRYGTKGILLFSALAGIGGVATAWYDREHVKDALKVGDTQIGQVGWGLNLALAASVAVVVVSLMLFVRRRER
jgi:hypothetical protein